MFSKNRKPNKLMDYPRAASKLGFRCFKLLNLIWWLPLNLFLALKVKLEFHYFKWAVKLPIHVYVGIIVETTNVFILLLCIKSTRNLRRLWNSKLKYKLAQKSVLRIQDFLGSTWHLYSEVFTSQSFHTWLTLANRSKSTKKDNSSKFYATKMFHRIAISQELAKTSKVVVITSLN